MHLDSLPFDLMDHQVEAIKLIDYYFVQQSTPQSLVITSPTGSGKSYIALAAQSYLPDSIITSPIKEVIVGLLKKLGYTNVDSLSDQSVFELGELNHIFTPLRLRNRLMDGSIRIQPKHWIIDEAHHYLAESYQELNLLLGRPKRIGVTATAFRGTPKATKAFRDLWEHIIPVLSYHRAAELGIIAIPEVEHALCLDDDQITVTGTGEFDVESIESLYKSRLLDCVEVIKGYLPLDRSTAVAVPSSNIGEVLQEIIPNSVFIHQGTKHRDRQKAIRETLACEKLLIFIDTISEGVDIQLRRIIDLYPRISPVAWLQMLGRIMRPGYPLPHYVCTNRNFLRHCYLLAGCLPSGLVSKSQGLFTPSERINARAVGLEAIGRFKPVRFKTRGDYQCYLYSITAVEGYETVEYACLVHPMIETPIWARRQNKIKEDGSYTYGTFERLTTPPVDLVGFKSHPERALTTGQLNFWANNYRRVGIHPDEQPNRKNFTLIPLLLNLRLALK